MRAALAILLVLAGAAHAAPEATETPSGLPVPRYVSLKFDTVNGRAGPSESHPIRWVYQRRGLPVQVVAETENWRRVRDPKGETVWMHKRTLDGRETVIALGETALLDRPEPGAEIAAVAETGVVMEVKDCDGDWTRLEAGGHVGWARPGALWGAVCGAAPARPPARIAGGF